MRNHDTRPQWPFKQVTRMSAHRRGQWCKKVDGKVMNFGPWVMPDVENRSAKAALDRYMEFIRSYNHGAQPEVVHAHD